VSTQGSIHPGNRTLQIGNEHRLLRALKSERRLAAALEPLQILYWIYAARLIISLGVFGAALLVSQEFGWESVSLVDREGTAIAVTGLAAAALLTPIAYFWSHRRRVRPGPLFMISQALLDIFVVNAVVHITGGYASPFVSLFIALAAAYALIVSLPAALLVALGTGLVYLVDNLVSSPEGAIPGLLVVQVAMFTLVAVVTSLIAVRLRLVRDQLGSVEGELRRLALDTADVLRIIPSGVITVDDQAKLVYLNLAASEMLGVDVARTLGHDVVPVFERRAPELARAVDETVRQQRRILNREIEIQTPAISGSPAGGDSDERAQAGEAPGRPQSSPGPGGAPVVPISVSSTTVLGASGGASYVFLLQDLRPVRQLEDLRLRTGRLEAVAEFSASLAHELKNPLASIRSAVEQLCGRAFEDDDDRILGRLIVRESDRLDGILKEFSDFARVDVSERRPIDVDELVRDVIETAGRHPVAEGRASLECERLDDLQGLWGDPELLHRSLLNLVLNALQVGDPDNPVHVKIISDSLRPDLVPGEISLGNPVRIRVIDDGPGIDPSDLPRIFDPFYTRRLGGSGLGLSIAHRAVQAHGGALLASSIPGEGATFAIVLPRRTGRGRLRSPGDVIDENQALAAPDEDNHDDEDASGEATLSPAARTRDT
jgi:two-component system sensor histidine kinase PilS (NtrC family)